MNELGGEFPVESDTRIAQFFKDKDSLRRQYSGLEIFNFIHDPISTVDSAFFPLIYTYLKSFNMLTSNTRKRVVDFIAGLFIVLFVYTAMSKLSDIYQFKYTLHKSPLLEQFAPIVAWGIPTLELLVSIALYTNRFRTLGLYSSLILMLGFTVYIGYMILYAPSLPCSCGGVISQLNWPQHFVFNCLFTLLALLAIILNRGNKTKGTRFTSEVNNPALL